MLSITDRFLLLIWMVLPIVGILLHLAGVPVHLSLAISSVLAVGVLTAMLERIRCDENSTNFRIGG